MRGSQPGSRPAVGGSHDGLIRNLLRIVCALVLLSVFAFEAPAQVRFTARPGQAVTIDTRPADIKVDSPGIRGTLEVKPIGTPPASYALVYTAPANVSNFTDAFRFTSGGQTVTAEVAVGAEGQYEAAFRILFLVFVIAVLLESGLAVIFHWRPFIRSFTGGTKTLVSVVVSYILVSILDLDLVRELGRIFSDANAPYGSGFLGRFITALIIAGGSSAVNTMMRTLGVRTVVAPEQLAPKPPRTEGWISVRLIRKQASGPVDVLIGDPAVLPVAGTIAGSGLSPFWRDFRRDPGSYPQAGGYSVPADKPCAVTIRAKDSAGSDIPVQPWGPHVIAPGAIIDLVFEA